VTRTKSEEMIPWVYMSRMASPAEKVSFAVTMGTIFSPDVGFDHLDSLNQRED
jgi:hypothetical protein